MLCKSFLMFVFHNAEGRHDGYLCGRRYFFCQQNHGLFLPLQDVLCVVNRKVIPCLSFFLSCWLFEQNSLMHLPNLFFKFLWSITNRLLWSRKWYLIQNMLFLDKSWWFARMYSTAFVSNDAQKSWTQKKTISVRVRARY